MRLHASLFLSLVFAATLEARDIFTSPEPGDAPKLVQALGDPNLRYGAALALARLGEPAVPALLAAAESDSADTRLWSAFALGRIGPDAASATTRLGAAAAQAAPALAAGLKHRSADVRIAAAEALRGIGPAAVEATPALIAVVERDREVELVRQTAMQSLVVVAGEARRDEAIKALEHAKESGNFGVRQLAEALLKELAQPSDPPSNHHAVGLNPQSLRAFWPRILARSSSERNDISRRMRSISCRSVGRL
jgi:HEAT repeat protein